MRLTAILISLCCAVVVSAQDNENVKMWEGSLELPSYIVDAPEVAPIFDRDYSYQRARRSVYPYPLNDNMTRKREMVSYKALYLENEYVQLCVLPEIGGRLFYAVDKTNGYDIFYRNDCIKPANVGMTGAWISGGVEWNVFHHHRSTSHFPSDYRLVVNEDGSKTIWVGETELRHRMSWAIGITLHPGKSYIEISGRLINSSQNSRSMLYWSNVATKVDKNYEIIYPQSVDFGTYHCKEAFCHWPVVKGEFRGNSDYDGVNVSWWKNLPTSNSIFIHDLQEDYIAGYDHGADAGTMLVGNHNIIKGGKFWLWGPNSEWDTKILSENAGHYAELMVGAYSDNQPDYNWTIPYEVKEFSQFWYGIRNIKGVKAGSKEAAINMDILDGGKVLVAANVTSNRPGCKVVLKNADNIVYESAVDLAPDAPFVKTLNVGKGTKDTDLCFELIDSNGNKMLSYTPVVKETDKPLPAIVPIPKLPHEIENNEECYLVGMRNMQFFNPYVDPTDYFKEVLRRDPYDIRSNTAMGMWLRDRGDYTAAKMHLRRAIKRQTTDYTRPKDCEALYNLGLILKDEGQLEPAIDTLYRAMWSYEFNSAANFQLAQMYVAMGDIPMALERLTEAIKYNGNNFNALGLKATLLRINGNKKAAEACLNTILETDPINAYATYEKKLLGLEDYFSTLMRDVPESYLELAITYWHNGFTDIAIKLLSDINSRVAYPSVKMYLGYFADLAGKKTDAKKWYEEALALSTDYCNMFRLESINVLDKATEYCPGNYKINYYLGNLFYDKQPDRAIKEWYKTTELNPSFALAWRNLGWGNWLHTKNLDEAIRCYRKAIELDPDKAIFLEEHDQLCEEAKVPVKVRYEMLKSHHKTAEKRYTPLANEVITGTFCGDYDYVLGLLRDCYFPTREGVANFHDAYADALMMAGQKKVSEGKYIEAVTLYKKAFEYPENQQVFLVDKRVPRDAQTYYMIGEAYEKAGQKNKAKEAYKMASGVRVKKTEYRYWQALSLAKLGRKDEAIAMFEAIEKQGRDGIVDSVFNFYGAEGTTGQTVETVNTKSYYIMGLGQLGQGKKAEALESFAKSLECRPNNLWADFMMNNNK